MNTQKDPDGLYDNLFSPNEIAHQEKIHKLENNLIELVDEIREEFDFLYQYYIDMAHDRAESKRTRGY